MLNKKLIAFAVLSTCGIVPHLMAPPKRIEGGAAAEGAHIRIIITPGDRFAFQHKSSGRPDTKWRELKPVEKTAKADTIAILKNIQEFRQRCREKGTINNPELEKHMIALLLPLQFLADKKVEPFVEAYNIIRPFAVYFFRAGIQIPAGEQRVPDYTQLLKFFQVLDRHPELTR